MHNTRNRRRKKHTGATLVEYAFAVPILFLTMFACLEFVRVGMLQGLAENAVYEADRHIIVPGSTKAEANRVLSILGTRGASVAVTATNADGTQTQIDDSTQRIAVDIAIPLAQNALFVAQFMSAENITAYATLTFESYRGFYDGNSS